MLTTENDMEREYTIKLNDWQYRVLLVHLIRITDDYKNGNRREYKDEHIDAFKRLIQGLTAKA